MTNINKGSQYIDSRNLNVRIKLHEMFSTNKQGFHEWIFSQLNLKENIKVLEIGCGPGALWYKNFNEIPKFIDITLVDLSAGMLEDAKKNIEEVTSSKNFKFVNANIEKLPFKNKEFDIVIANHMLYHVPDISAGLAEVKRVLKDNGVFYSSTFSKDHLHEINCITRKFVDIKKNRTSDRFCIEKAEEQLNKHFSSIKLFMHQDSLIITESQPLIDYIMSGSKAKETLVGDKYKEFSKYINECVFETGVFNVQKKAGVFISKK